MYPLIRPLLFGLDPERAHALTVHLLRIAGIFPGVASILRRMYHTPVRSVDAFGLKFANPLGLAAGYDKDGLAWRGLACLGFGHIEIGTVTLQAQQGNPQPRLFRLAEENALINRMGFPGRGAEFVAKQLRRPRPPGLKIGVNLGKNAATPLESAVQDYLDLMKIFAPLADYLVINVSSPNTVGLRRLQARHALDELLSQLRHDHHRLQSQIGHRVPLLVKLSPDLSEDELQDAVEVILNTQIDGVIATNTTISREGVESPLASELGGLSGQPLREPSTQMIQKINALTQGKLPIIGVGGVMSAQDTREKLAAGAVLVQVYTGLIYKGPGLVNEIITSL